MLNDSFLGVAYTNTSLSGITILYPTCYDNTSRQKILDHAQLIDIIRGERVMLNHWITLSRGVVHTCLTGMADPRYTHSVILHF